MPEGPQVYRAAEKLRTVLSNVILKSVLVSHGSTSTTPTSSDELSQSQSTTDHHQCVTGVITKGKRLVITLDDGMAIVVAFALGGTLEYHTGPQSPLETAATVAIMTFQALPGSGVIYITLSDPQHLASVTVTPLESARLATGFDPLHIIVGMREWFAICKSHPAQLVATFLTTQSIVAGIGNRYRSEILHVANIYPFARVRDLTPTMMQVLLVTIYRVLKTASRGEYEFAVYGLKTSKPEGKPVARREVAKGVLVWTTYDGPNVKEQSRS